MATGGEKESGCNLVCDGILTLETGFMVGLRRGVGAKCNTEFGEASFREEFKF
ncbi:hypothetical protein CHS0354_030329 [Potamilus streckersoni]|uniref:Uncharacterized protein n=1 Tax=Potamilus streckersoni TaxID=2493646 RepID=A0AAE0T5C7_9BIVA|nr:hypothetical protein CHS0354_030329 [Potamilus streckersoni]